jgi:hypothetical protein
VYIFKEVRFIIVSQFLKYNRIHKRNWYKDWHSCSGVVGGGAMSTRRILQKSATGPCPVTDESLLPCHPISFKDSFWFINAYIFKLISFFQVFRPKFCEHFLFLPYIMYAPPILSTWISSPWHYLLKITNYEAHYASFFQPPVTSSEPTGAWSTFNICTESD